MKHKMEGQGWRKTIGAPAHRADASGAIAQGQEKEEDPGADPVIDGGVVDHGIGIEVTEEADPGTGRGEEGGKPWEFFVMWLSFLHLFLSHFTPKIESLLISFDGSYMWHSAPCDMPFISFLDMSHAQIPWSQSGLGTTFNVVYSKQPHKRNTSPFRLHSFWTTGR